MPFANAPQRQHKSDRTARYPRLVRMGDNTGVEQRGRFKSIFFAKIRPDEQRLLMSDSTMIDQQTVDLVKASLENELYVAVALLQAGGNTFELNSQVRVAQREYSVGDALRARAILRRDGWRVFSGDEGTNNDARRIGL